MEDLNFGDEVEWIRGAIGLTGRVVDCITAKSDCDEIIGSCMLLVVLTPKGVVYEYETNLRKVQKDEMVGTLKASPNDGTFSDPLAGL